MIFHMISFPSGRNMFLSFRADFVFDFGCMAIYGTTVHWPCLLTVSCTICSCF